MASPKLQFADALRHHRAGRLKQAEQGYRNVLRQQPCHREALRQIGALARQLGRQQLAIEHLQRALKRKPTDADLLCQLGDAKLGQGDADQARACYEAVVCPAKKLKPERQPPPEALAGAHFRLGNLHKALGRLDEAAEQYRQALAADPRLAKAAVNLGNVLLAQGRVSEAAERYRVALAVDDANAVAHSNLGYALQEQGAREQAVGHYRRALELRPDFVAAALNLGAALSEMGRLDEALTCLRRLVASAPGSADAHNNLGCVLQQQELLDEAVAAFRRAISLKPDWAEPHSNLGLTLRKQGLTEASIAECRRAVQLDPRLAEAYNNLGNALKDDDRLDEAEPCFRESLRLQPRYAEAWSNLGVIRQWQGHRDEAVECFQRALELNSCSAAAYNNLGYVRFDQEQYEPAEAAFRQATWLDAKYVDAWCNLGRVLQAQGKIDEAANCFSQLESLRPEQPIWRLQRSALCPVVFDSAADRRAFVPSLVPQLDEIARQGIGLTAEQVVSYGLRPPFAHQFLPGNLRPLREAYARVFFDAFATAGPPRTADATAWRGRSAAAAAPGNGPHHVGMLVTERHERAFVKSLARVIKALDPGRFRITVICSPTSEAKLREAFRQDQVRLLPIRPPLSSMVREVREAQLDLLYYWEIATDTVNYFLPFCRLAPVQCTSWGIQITSGIPQVDYYLSSGLIESASAQDHYSERLLLAETLLTCQGRVPVQPDRLIRRELGFGDGDHLYFCMQQLGKFAPEFDAVLADILRRDPCGKIVLAELDGAAELARLKHRFATQLPDVHERIVFLPAQPRDRYLQLMEASEAILDPIGFGGVNTTYDALSLDRPLVTLPTEYHRGRYALGCYRKIGVDEFVARDEAHYAELAVALATQPEYRAAAIERLRRATPALFDDTTAVDEHHRLFTEMIEAGPRRER
jgi:tetratricopeptide (TPR) repeat protein